jgi:threonine dehydratase
MTTTDSASEPLPTLEAIRDTRNGLGDRIVETPVRRWSDPLLDEADTQAWLKEELFQRTGTFKARGALSVMLGHLDDALARGVTTVSAGNHAMAVGYAARALGASAKVVMPRSASPIRVEKARGYGAEVVLVDHVHAAFEEVRRIEAEEGRLFVHPFEGLGIALGTATLGLELMEQLEGELDAVIVPIGGGGLCAGVSSAVKLLRPRGVAVYGVEPEGADTMHRSFEAGRPQGIDQVRTIADSLGAPYAEPYSFGLCRRYVDDLVRVSDDQIREAMHLLFHSAKLAVEPAGAAATAALLGPLRPRLRGRRVALIVCGANIDAASYSRHLADHLAH